MIKGLLALFTLAMLFLGSSYPTRASTPIVGSPSAAPPIQTYRNQATGRCLDGDWGSVYTLLCNGGPYQKWRVLRNSGGTVTLQSLRTGFCVDSAVNGHAYTLSCNGGSYQKWWVLRNNNGSIGFQNLATGLVLDSNSDGRVYTLGDNGGPYQQWR